MSRVHFARALLTCVLLIAGVAQAQDTPPTGPAQIMNRANQGRAQRGMAEAAATGDKAAKAVPQAAPATAANTAGPQAGSMEARAVPPAAPINPHAADPHSALDTSKPTADAAPELPKGTLDIEVVDVAGRPYANGEIVLGVMQSMGGRTEERAKTDANGRYTFRALAVGSGQAYRVNVVSGGAKFSSNPFRLPDDSGFLYDSEAARKAETFPLHKVTCTAR